MLQTYLYLHNSSNIILSFIVIQCAQHSIIYYLVSLEVRRTYIFLFDSDYAYSVYLKLTSLNF